MIQLANAVEDKYLSHIASKTILEGLELIYGIVVKTGELDETQFEMIYETEFPGFFSGIGAYFSQDDDSAGKEILARKVTRMREKLLDENEFYIFDLLEEYLFAKAIRISRDLKEDGLYFLDEEEEKQTIKVLSSSKYELDPDEAEETAHQLHRLYMMGINDSPLFFWDDDYSFFWSKGFVEGIKLMKSTVGDQLGYGYDEAEEIFSDIDIKPPIRLLGSREANRLINEEEARRMEEKTDSLFKDPGDLEKLLGTVADMHDASVDEVSSSIEDLLKTIPEDILQEEFGGVAPSIEDFIKYVIGMMKKDEPELIGIFLDNLDPEDEASARKALDLCNAFYQVNKENIMDDDLHNLYDAAREYKIAWPQPLGRAVLEAIDGYPFWEKDDKTGLM